MPLWNKALPLLLFCLLVNRVLLPAQNTVVDNPSACGLQIEIPDNNCTPNGTVYLPEIVEIVEQNTPGILGTDVFLSEVRIILDHTWVNDVNLTLVSPSGVQVLLTANNGGGDDNFGDPDDPTCGTYTTFAVGGCVPIEAGVAPFLDGPYSPEEHFYTFNDGITPANGSWLLLLCDDAVGDTGSLEYVELIFEPLSCLPVANLTVTDIDTTSVQLSWQPNDFCGTIILEYGPPGFTPGNDSTALGGTVAIVDCTPVTLTGLLPDTDYELYLRRYCETTGLFSPNGCPESFVTGCQPPPVSTFENFDNLDGCIGNCLADCDISGVWKNARNDDMDWIVNSGSTNTPGTGPSDDISNGGNYIYLETSGCESDMEAILYSSCIQLNKQGTDTCHLSFNYHMFGFTIGSLSLEVSEDGGFTWTGLWSKTGNQGDAWHKTFVGLGDYDDGDILQFRFVGVKTSGLKGDIALDEIVIYGSEPVGEPEVIHYLDADSDGYGDDAIYVLSCSANSPEGYVLTPGDCNDADETINPGAMEIPCDEIDNNCNIDEIDDDIILPPPPAFGDTICSGEIPTLCAMPVEGNFILWYDAVKRDSVVGFGECFSPEDLPVNNSPVPVEFTYLVGQTLDFDCFTVDLAEVKVIINPLPDVYTDETPEVCPGESLNLASLSIQDANFTGGQITFHSQLPAGPENLLEPPLVEPLQTMDYYFQMTSPDGCTDEGTVTVTVKPGPDLDFLPADSFSLCRESTGVITVEATGGTGAYEYFWSTGSSQNTIEVESAFFAGEQDLYHVTVTDEEGCFTIDSVQVTTTNSIDSVRVFVTDVSECDGSDGGLTVIPLNGLAPFDFSWTSSDGLFGTLNGITDTAFITGLPQGVYRIEINDSSDEMCTFYLRNVIVQGPGAVIMDPEVADVSCFNADDGEICLNVQGGNEVTYLWDTGDTTLCVSGLSGGSYAVTITSGECETVLDQIQVEEPDSLFAIYDIEMPSCHDSSDGSISLTTFGGSPPYQYQWSTNDISPYILDQPVGNYLVVVTDFNDCSFIESLPLAGPEPLEIQLDSLKDMSCNGVKDGYIQVSGLGGTPPYQYQWSNGSTSPVLPSLTQGSFEVTVTDFNGCEKTAEFSINNPDVLEINLSVMVQPDCLGDSTGMVTLEASGGTPPFTFFGPLGEMGDNTIEELPVGIYTFYVEDRYGCQSEPIEVELTSFATLDFGIDITAPACQGPATGSINLQPTGIEPFSYLWPLSGDTTAFVNQLEVGEYPVRVIDGQGCIYDTTLILSAPQVFNLDFAVSDPSCFGVNDGLIDVLILDSGVPPFATTWNDGNVSGDRTDLAQGNYQLTITDQIGCTFISDTISLNYPDPLMVEVEAIGLPICHGDVNGYIETNISGGTTPYQINWLGTGLTTEDISDLLADDYRLILMDANGCAVDTTFILSEPDPLIPLVEILQGEECTPATADTLVASAVGGNLPYSFYWSEGSQGEMLTGVNPGNYGLTVEDASGCLAVLDDIKLKEKTGAIVLDSFIVNGISCAGYSDANMAAFISNGTGDYLYHFTPTYIVNTGQESVTRQGLSHSPEYSVTVTDIGSGCTVESEPVNLTPPLPLTVSQDSFHLSICFGGNDGAIYITPSGGTPEYQFQWFDESGELVSEEEDIEQMLSGVYTLTLTDANGCSLTVVDSSVIDQNPLIVNDTTIITDVVCRGDSTGVIDISVSGGVPPFTYEWSYGNTSTEDLVGVPFGSYTVTVTDADTCRAIFPFFTVSQPPTAIEAQADSLHPPSCFDSMDGFIMTSVQGGGAPYEYYWTYGGETMPGEVENELQDVGAGQYELVVTDTLNCQEVFGFELVGPDLLMVDLLVTPPDPPDETGMITAMVEGGVPEYHFLWSTGDTTMSINIAEEATYGLTITDANNCEIADSVMVVPLLEMPESLVELKLFPNPAGEFIFIDIALDKHASLALELVNVTGKRVKRQQWPSFQKGIIKWDLQEIPPGVYFLRTQLDLVLENTSRIIVLD